ncbi:MAG TPA: 3-keto-5-aminohexanoate cleavage protein [Candidatus Acidoferrum sp.]|nr:3-keto-5-aminohexanoate cleavage protein [Candidatus Acidoferrum sp.]
MTNSKVVVTCALTGALANRDQCPYIPYTPEEIAEEARRAREAGAAVVHIHARERDGRPSVRVEMYREILEAVRARTDIIVNFSTGAVGIPMEERVAHIRELRPEIGALNMGSMNYAIYSAKKKTFYWDLVFANPFKDIIYLLTVMNEAGVRPELECFDTGHIGNTAPLMDMGLLRPPLQFSLIMGVLGGIPATTPNLLHQVQSLPSGSIWEVIGVSLEQWALTAAAITLGGNVRVGFEDNFYLEEGKMARSNGELVTKAVRLCRDLGREVATPAEARALLRLQV